MAGTYTHLGTHFVFSTKNRLPLITKNIKSCLHQYIGGVIKEINGIPIEINSMPDHIHIYSYVPKTIAVSKFMEKIKSASSKWINQKFSNQNFAWQEGYGAFSVSKSSEKRVVEYIQGQEEHHKHKSFQEEFLEFLKVYNIS